MEKITFQEWLIQEDDKTQNTAYSYKNAIPKLSKHYSSLIGKTTDLHYADIKTLKRVEELYSLQGNEAEFGSNSKGINRNAIVALIRFYETFPEVSAKTFYQTITSQDVIDALEIVDTKEIKLQNILKFAVVNKKNGNQYPPKEIIRIIARKKQVSINENSLNGGEANEPFERLGYKIISNQGNPSYNKSLVYPQIVKYQNAIDNTDWLRIDESYKFNFLKWIEDHIDFENDTNNEIKKKIEESQLNCYSPGSNIKGINFIQTITRYHDDYVTIADLEKIKTIIQNKANVTKENLTLSFKSFPKTSIFLCLFAPDQFMAYDGESIPAFEYFSIGLGSTAPKRDFKAFEFYQTFYSEIKQQLKESRLDTAVFKEILKVDTLTELHWNFITQDFLLYIAREVMTNTLQKKYDDFISNGGQETLGWYKKIRKYSEAINLVKENCRNNEYDSYSELNQDFKKLVKNEDEDFLQRYLFESSNGFSTIKQQLIKIKQRKIISDKVNNNFNLLKTLLVEKDKHNVMEFTHKLIGDNNWSVIYRFLRALFPNDFTSVDAPKHFETLVNKLDAEFNISLVSNNQIDKNEEILNLIQYDDIYKAQIFFWIYKEESTEKASNSEQDNDNTMSEPKPPLNQILYGPPGTGKTYATKKIAVEIIENVSYSDSLEDRETIVNSYNELVEKGQIHFITFHQSMSYEDFIEGIKPKMGDGNNREIEYEIKSGLFKQVCQSANQKETTNFEEAFTKLTKDIVESEEEYLVLNTPRNKEFRVNVNSNGNLTLYTSKKINQYGTLTADRLHDFYFGAPTFIGWEGYANGIIDYLKNNYNLSKEIKDPNQKYVLIIDEINRGNVSAIFGELITLIEEDKRKGEGKKETIHVTLPYSQEKFSVPNNVYLIGTMNTADRSVEALDSALRRRFSFKELLPKAKLLSDHEYKDVNLSKLLKRINQRIELLLDKDHQIGHSYFFNINSLDDLKIVFKDKIFPLLEEYFYGDFGKIGLVLGENFIEQKKVENKNILAPFKAYEDIDFVTDKKIFRPKNIDDMEESDFVSVYQSKD